MLYCEKNKGSLKVELTLTSYRYYLAAYLTFYFPWFFCRFKQSLYPFLFFGKNIFLTWNARVAQEKSMMKSLTISGFIRSPDNHIYKTNRSISYFRDSVQPKQKPNGLHSGISHCAQTSQRRVKRGRSHIGKWTSPVETLESRPKLKEHGVDQVEMGDTKWWRRL